MDINKVVVIGAGVMGAGIAGQISNAHMPVMLLDIVPKGDGDRNRNLIAQSAVKHLLQSKPAALMHPKNTQWITTGNIEDHLELLVDADWVIEAIIEDLEHKQSLYRTLDSVCPDHTLISSNTSTLPLHLLTRGMTESFKKRFVITHFFNPPRYMRLLEIVPGPEADRALIEKIITFADTRLGKTCISCKDTPGFIANRIGVYWLQCGLLQAIEMGLTVEEADAVISRPFGIPKTGIFGLLDLIGLDLIPHILKGMQKSLPANDAFQQLNRLPALLEQMIADGFTGRKGKGGFYRLQTAQGKRVKESLDLATGQYHPSEKPHLASLNLLKDKGLQAFLSSEDKTALYARTVIGNTLLYAASLVPEIADDILSIDTAMKRGFNWQFGPFELIDQLGIKWLNELLKDDDQPSPLLLESDLPFYANKSGNLSYRRETSEYFPIKRPSGQLWLADIKLKQPPVLQNPSASLWDIADGITCLEFHSKMNTLDMASMDLIEQGLEKTAADFSAMVIYNEADNFSAGANLGLLLHAMEAQQWHDVEQLLNRGQQVLQTLKYAPFPVVGAPAGLALGGGCEILLHCDAVQAHAELYMGLVETGVGLIPAWGGSKELLRRCLEQNKRPGGPVPPVVKAFQTLSLAKVSGSAAEARDLLYLAPSDQITMNRDRLLADAKARALELSVAYQPPEAAVYALPGKSVNILLQMGIQGFRLLGKASTYDTEVAGRLAYVLSGGDCDLTSPLDEAAIHKLEREAFLHLARQNKTRDRIEHMLKTGKPLRN